MAALTRGRLAVVCAAGLLAGCGDLKGLGGSVPPLVTFQIEATGNLTALRPPGVSTDASLQVALVWGAQWWTEPFCILPPESDSVAAVIAAGCRDPFGFVPAQVGASVPVVLNQPTTLSLYGLPTAALLVGDVTSRVGYASFVLYDDHDGSGTLELSTAHAAPSGGRDGPGGGDSHDSTDIVYGASFVTMTAPDVRASFLQGSYEVSGFYPRQGCADPPLGFGVLGAGGFTAADALAASAAGTIPTERDPSACFRGLPSSTLVSFAAQSPTNVTETSCSERTLDGSTRYLEPPTDDPGLAQRVWACAHLPSFGAQPASDLVQLVVAGLPADRCKGLTHYTLRGCREDVACAIPDWDFTANPPSWWPCPQ
jgi:hypothetical protein